MYVLFCFFQTDSCYVYCPHCNLAWKGWNENSYLDHPNHTGESVTFPGVYIQLDFISELEENVLMKGIDEMPWELSQSGRRKQVKYINLNKKDTKILFQLSILIYIMILFHNLILCLVHFFDSLNFI